MPLFRQGVALVLALPFCVAAQAGTFGFDPYVQIPSYGETESVAIGDVDGDGRDDLVAVNNAYFSNTWSNHVLIYPQLADGTLAQPIAIAYTTSYGGGRGLVLADIDADGVRDIAVGYSGGLALLRHDGTGGFSLRQIATGRGGDLLASLDVDRNGVADLVGLGHNGPARVYYADGFGGIASQQDLATQASGFNDLEVGDLDGNGLPDLAVMSGQLYATPNLTVHRHDGSVGWLAPQSYFVGSSELTNGLAVGDFDGDGRDDAVLSRGRNSPTWLWQYRQNAAGQLQPIGNLASYQIPGPLEAFDLDRDGRTDLGVLHGGWLRFGFHLQGAGGLGAEQLVTIPYQSHYRQQGLAFGDLNSDGCTDMAIAYSSGVVRLDGHDCVPQQADLAVSIRAEARTAVVQVDNLAGRTTAPQVRVELRPRRYGRVEAPAGCVPQPSTGRVLAYDCALAPLAPGAQQPLRFVLGAARSVVVSADAASDLPDPEESNNSATVTLQL